MSIVRVAVVLGAISIVIGLLAMPGSVPVLAQTPDSEKRPWDRGSSPDAHVDEGEKERKVTSAGDLGGQGLADPPPSGLSVLYTFTGARYVSGTAATSVHCTNYGSESATVRVEIYDFDNVSSATFSGQATVASNRTATFSTGNTQFYDEDVSMSQPSSEAINQGSGRVMSNKRTLICTAQVLDPAHTQPWFAVQLALHYPDGTPVNAYYNAAVYLPTILRSD